MRVLILDDHTLFREGLKLLINGLHSDLITDEADTIAGTIALVEQHKYDLILLDLNLAEMTGIDTLDALKAEVENTPVVVVSAEQDPPTIYKAIEHGAMGYITKCTSHKELLAAIKLILAGGIFLPREVTLAPAEMAAKVTAQTSEKEVLSTLSERQRDVLKFLLQGKPNKTISHNLEISENTVKAHLSAIYRALGARNRTEAVYFAARAGVPLD